METLTEKNNLLQKIYRFFQSNIGIGILLLLDIFLSYPLGANFSDSLSYTIGTVTGFFLATYVVILVLSRKFKWTNRQKVLHAFLIIFLLSFFQKNQTISSLQNIIFILFLLIELGLIIVDFFKRIFRK